MSRTQTTSLPFNAMAISELWQIFKNHGKVPAQPTSSCLQIMRTADGKDYSCAEYHSIVPKSGAASLIHSLNSLCDGYSYWTTEIGYRL